MITPIKKIVRRVWAWFSGEDVFISYARIDGANYAAGLASALASEDFSCVIDQWGSPPGAKVPPELRRALRRCGMMVIVTTPGAVDSENVQLEVEEFLSNSKRILPIDFSMALQKTPWRALVEGVHPAAESLEEENRLVTGVPSESVLRRIQHTATFRRKNARLRRAAYVTTFIILVLIVIGLLLSDRATQAVEQANVATLHRDTARAEKLQAETDRNQAYSEKSRAELARDKAISAHSTESCHRFQAKAAT